MTTFEDFQMSRRHVDNVHVATGFDPDDTTAPEGYVYLNSFYVEIHSDHFSVPIGNSEHQFTELGDAERYLWEEWARAECAS